MVKLLLLRHGESVANNSNKFCGQMDSPLTETGLVQAEEVAKFILKNYKVDAIYSSDLLRVKQTVAPTVKAFNILPIETKLLREVDVGWWQDKLFLDVKKIDFDNFTRYIDGDTTVKLGGKESLEDLRERALTAVQMILEGVGCDGNNKTVVVATHGGIIRMLVETYLNLTDIEMRKKHPVFNASLTEIDFEDGKPEIKRLPFDEYLSNKTCVSAFNSK